MSQITQKPIYKRQCVQWENKIVGFEDLTEEQWAELEQFSNEIPGVIGPTLEELQVQQFTSVNPINPVNIPSVIVPVNPIPIEDIGWLFGILAIILMFIMSGRK